MERRIPSVARVGSLKFYSFSPAYMMVLVQTFLVMHKNLLRCTLPFCLSFSLFADGELEQFEREASRSKPSSSQRSVRRESPADHRYDFGESVADEFADNAVLLGAVLLAAGGAQAAEVADQREDWSPMVPVARLDFGYQWADADVSAWDVGGAVGRGLVAVGGRHTVFREEGEREDLKFSQAHAFYRMAILSHVELGLGFGAAWLNGAENETGFSFALPFRWWPVEWGGVEVRSVWTWFNSVRLSDIETAAMIRYKGAHLQAGYRWLEIEDDRGALNGFRVGIGLRY